MPTRNVNSTELLPQHEQEDTAKLQWLRGAVKDAAESIGRGEGIELEDMDSLAAYIRHIGEEVFADRNRDNAVAVTAGPAATP